MRGHSEMFILTIASLSAGLALAQRFKVLILPPVALLILLVSIGKSVAGGGAALPTGLTATWMVVSLQIGYLLGASIAHMIAVARTTKLRATLIRNASSLQRIAQHYLSGRIG
jgi:hypothetical protein